MSRSRTARIAVLASVAALALAPAAMAAKGKPLAPRGQTGGAQHVLSNGALLTGLVIPNGQETTYYFVYGTTTAYGSQTTPASIPGTIPKEKVGQPASRLLPATTYHFALVVTYPGAAKPIIGRDHTFATRGSALTFEVPRTMQATYGTPFLFAGTLRGASPAAHQVSLEASPFPYLESFTPIGAPTVTNSAGRFAFRVANLTVSTQMRLSTLDRLPIYSRTVEVLVSPRVTLHVRRSASGLVRLYGTITPAVKGAKVIFQVQKTVRPNKNEVSTRFVGQFTTSAKKGGGNSSRFSMVVSVRHGGLYRAYVKLRNGGPLVSGSSNTVLLHKS
jgi:hypothetical protein